MDTSKIKDKEFDDGDNGFGPKNIYIAPNDLDNCIKKLFNNIIYLIQRGKGYSIYNISNSMFMEILSILEGVLKSNYNVVKVSNLTDSTSTNIHFNKPIVIYQDLDRVDLLKYIDILVNKIVYPAWYKNCSIIFISSLDKRDYNVGIIQSSMIHNDYNHVINLLTLEQLDNLLELVNANIVSPETLLTYDEDILYTPIEKIFKDKLIERNISFKPQVKLGRFYVDFLLEINNSNIIVECDGREYHDKVKDNNRDKELKKEGYKIYRFSGSRIFNNCDKCIDEIILYTSKNTVSKYILEELNEEQIAAVNHISGPIRVLAPAGSGKTKTLVNRIVNLVNSGIQETEILALAFNKKAEIEMSKRLSEKFNLSNVEVRTFHSFGNNIIRETLKWKFDGDTQEKITRSLLEKSVNKFEKIVYLRNKDPLDQYLAMLSKSKNELLSKSEMIVEIDEKVINFEPMFNDYIDRMIDHNFYNFDDMLYIAIRRLLSDPASRRKIQSKYRYILVDEFQDLNKAQLLLLQILILPENNIFICGDDDQMIYSFRGAEVKHILEFNKRYSINSDQILKINYRSASDIVRHSKWLIDHNKIRVYKEITPFSKDKGDIQLFIGNSLKDQGEKIAEWILKLKNDNTSWSDFAVVYRYNQYKDLLYLILSQYKIPVPFDGIKILNSRVGKCIMSYFNIIYNKENSTPSDYEEVLKRPNKYLTNEFIKTITSWEEFINIDKIKLSLREMDIARYINFVDKFKLLNTDNKRPVEILNFIVENFGLRDFFKDEAKASQDIDVASETDVLEIIISFSETFNNIEEFYNFWLDLRKSDTKEFNLNDNKEDVVNLTSIHKTKGNEYKHVAYFNLVRSVTLKATDTVMEEERRIAYVGVTRPKDHLLITTERNELSPFINEIFLNPKYYDSVESDLENKLNQIHIELNVLKSNLVQIESEINELIIKYPELKGIYISSNGFLKKVKQSIRKINLNKASKTYQSYNNKYTNLLEDAEKLSIEKNSIENELKYRKIIEESKEH